MLNPFTPGSTVSVSATGTTSRVALPATRGNQIRVAVAAGGSIAFVRFGTTAVNALVTDTPVLPGTIEIFTVPTGMTHVAGITSTGTATVYFTAGDGQ